MFSIPSFICLIISLSIHERAHAYSAYLLGDKTAYRQGRMTINPLAHIDPIGLVAMLFLPIGRAKPVPINIYNMKQPLRDELIVALA
jgi:Zn-dependent protease